MLVRFTFIQLPAFIRDCHRLELEDDAVREIESVILTNPNIGKVVTGTGALRKMRFSPSGTGRGKSGAFRVLYACITRYQAVYFFAAYAKNEKENISAAEKRQFKKLLDELKE